jgi:hypothetical protein
MAKREERWRSLGGLAYGFIVVAAAESCGGTTRLGKTGEGGAAGTGGTRADSGAAESGGIATTGGRRGGGSGGCVGCGTGGRTTGGVFGSGGQTTGGVFGSGGRVVVDASASDAASRGGVAPFDAGSDPDRNRVLPGHVCERLTEIQCASEARCCPTTSSRDVCMRERLARCQSARYLDLLSQSPMIAYDVDRAEAAFTEFEKRASRCDLDILQWMFSDAGFRNVTLGTIAPGGDCTPRTDGGFPIEYLGSCAEPESYSCVNTTPTGDTWKCMPRGMIADPCYTDYNCRDGLSCQYDQQPVRMCGMRRPDGMPCVLFTQCESFFCDAGACKPATLEKVYCQM